MRESIGDRPWGRSVKGLWTSILLLSLAGLLTYANNYRGEFIFDDFPAIVDNPAIKTPWSPGPLLRPVPDGGPLAGRPVVALSMAMNYAVGGLEVGGYHLVNNLIHILAALTLFGLIRSTLLLPHFAEPFGQRANGYGLAVALLWLLHPLQTESVNYITQRTEMLVGAFYLLTLFCASAGFRAVRPGRWYAAAVAACALGMASKEVMASAPLMVLLYDRLFVAGSFKAAFRQRQGFYAALAATWLVVGFYQLDNPRAGSVLFNTEALSVLDYFRTQLTVIVHYLRLAFWPQPLVLDCQDWPIVRTFSAGLIFPVVLLGGMGWATVAGIRRGDWWSILGAWFFCILAPTSSFIPIITEIVAERRMYLPLAAVVILAVFCGDYLLRLAAGRFLPGGRAARIAPAVVLITISAVFAGMTFARNDQYRTAVSIWADTVAKRPGNSRAQENLGKALMVEGRYGEAAEHFREAVRLFPSHQPQSDMAEIYSSFGACLAHIGNFQESMLMHRKAVELQPDDNLVYYHLGNAYLRGNDLAKAANVFRQSIGINPDFPPAHGNLGLVLMQQGDLTGAEQHLRRLLELSPKELNSYALLADLLIRQGRFAEAAGLYRSGIARGISPDELTALLTRLLDAHPEKVGT